MVEGAQLSKAPIQALGDRVSAYFVPIVALASLIVFVVWYSCGEPSMLLCQRCRARARHPDVHASMLDIQR